MAKRRKKANLSAKKAAQLSMASIKPKRRGRPRKEVAIIVNKPYSVTWDILLPTPSFPAENDVLDVVSKAYKLVSLCGSIDKAKEVLNMYERLAHA